MELRPGQLLVGRQQRRFDDLIGGGGRAGGGGGGRRRDGDVAELSGEVGGTEAAVLLETDAAVLTEQRTDD